MASIDYNVDKDNGLKITLTGKLNIETVGSLWRKAFAKLDEVRPKSVHVDASGVEYCDSAGIAFLLELKRKQQTTESRIEIQGLRDEFQQLFDMFTLDQVNEPVREKLSFHQLVDRIGQFTTRISRDLYSQVSFAGELFTKFTETILHPDKLRLRDTLLITEKAGADAVGITALLGFLMGLILAFQAVITMRKFGAEIFVADMVTISLLRELGPLMTGFILASRTGSAFAAEIGTMKVNEEIDALTTMGFDPVRFLVIPRVIAGVFVMPLLTIFNHIFGLIGCFLVMSLVGFTPIAVINQIRQAGTLGDLFGGLVKTLVFGVLIAGIGCMRGLQTGTGASAVGDSATRAVVASIVAIIIADGVFAVVYYFLGI
jgi:phospholipid/cholesterol/gamma-HCH transport system permease protein